MPLLKQMLASLLLATTLFAGAENVLITGAKEGNWWLLGETVKFQTASKIPAEAVSIEGEVFDADGATAERHSVTAADFKKDGWCWTPKKPGFYTVKFKWIDAAGKASALGATVKRQCRRQDATIAATKDFLFDETGFVVAPGKTRKPTETSPQFGFFCSTYGGSYAQMVAKSSALIGGRFIRIHEDTWAKSEPEEGKFDWRMLDHTIGVCKKEGFEEFVLTLQGTPKWAVEKPSSDVSIMAGYLGQPPKDLKYFTDFITAVQTRYPFIKRWELWNEPGVFPGQSCFWLGSPDEFCELLKAAYQTVKKQQPDAKCYIGAPLRGMHEHLIKKGYDKYYDAVSRHGSLYAYEKQTLEEKLGATPKSYAVLEWPGIQVDSVDYPYPSEKELCHNMIVDFVTMLRGKAECAAFFAPLGQTANREVWNFYRVNGGSYWMHEGGLFSHVPTFQPRLPALVWRNFVDLFSGDVKYVDSFSSGSQFAAILESDSGKVLLLWQNTKDVCKPDAEFAKALAPSSEIFDWEGNKIDPAKFVLKPAEVYFVKAPALTVAKTWTSDPLGALRRFTLNARPPAKLDNSVNGHYKSGRLFDDNLKVVEPNQLPWNEVPHYIALDGKPKAEGFEAKYALAFQASGLDLLVSVKDGKHVPAVDASRSFWNGDSIQFALDTRNTGRLKDRLEFIAALGKDGVILWKQQAPNYDGFLPGNCSIGQSFAKYAKVEVSRKEDETLYKIHIDSSELFPLEFEDGQLIRFSLLVNDNDGAGRAGWLEWASGIGKASDTSLHGNLTLARKRGQILSQKDMKESWSGSPLTISGDLAKVIANDKSISNALSSTVFKLPPNSHCKLRFLARGNVPIEVALNSRPGNERFDLLPATPLDGTWKEFNTDFITPTGFDPSILSIFCHKVKGEFEIKELSLDLD